MSKSKCKCFTEYMKAQHAEFTSAIDEDKWYLSEKAGFDVGIEKATSDFCHNHLDEFAKQFRIKFCTEDCPESNTCPLSSKVHEMGTIEEYEQIARTQSAK